MKKYTILSKKVKNLNASSADLAELNSLTDVLRKTKDEITQVKKLMNAMGTDMGENIGVGTSKKIGTESIKATIDNIVGGTSNTESKSVSNPQFSFGLPNLGITPTPPTK